MKNQLQTNFLKPKSIRIYQFWHSFCILTLLINISGASLLGLSLPRNTSACVIPSWDKSSLAFQGGCIADLGKLTAQVCNTGEKAMSKPTAYEVWQSATSDAKSGNQVYRGSIPVLSAGKCTEITYASSSPGKFQFKVFQSAGHPGVGYLWSETCETKNSPTCGDGIVNACGEQCDNPAGNGIVCNPQYGESCTYCSDKCVNVEVAGYFCGDNIKNGTEECDGSDGSDANQICDEYCKLVVVPFCGDKILNGIESCETDTVESCVSDSGYQGIKKCTGDCSGWSECVVQESCGDGKKNNNEQCDGADGISDRQICTAQCLIEETPYCGDGKINRDSESCDSGAGNGISCSAVYGGSCEYCTTDCVKAEVKGDYCGDGMMNGDEQCDKTDGVSGHKKCNASCVLEDIPFCGDNKLNRPEEECDGSATSTPAHQSCNLECKLEYQPYCGDGKVNGDDEVCDEGIQNGLVCRPAYGFSCNYCNSDCTKSETLSEICGDAKLNGNEQCDDGNKSSGDGCNSECVKEVPAVSGPSCGNGIKESDEECDKSDGLTEGFRCSDACDLESVPSNPVNAVIGGAVPFWTNVSAVSRTIVTPSVVLGVAIKNDPMQENEIASPAEPALTIEKSVNKKEAHAGDSDILYSLVINNIGAGTADDVVVTDILPAGLSFDDGTRGVKKWELGNIEAGDMVKINYGVKIDEYANVKTYKNIARVSALNFQETSSKIELRVVNVPALAETGFDLYEFLTMAILAISMAGCSLVVRREIHFSNN